MRELLLEIGASIRRNKLRTALTGFSVAWGIFMLVILLGSGNGLKNGVLSNFGNYATNSISLAGGWTSAAYKGYTSNRHIQLYNSDLESLVSEIPQIDRVAANAWFDSYTATYGNQFMQSTMRGVLPDIEQIEGVTIVAGRFINAADLARYRKVVVIGQNMQQILFKGEDPLGRQIKIGNSTFSVVGVYKADATRMDAVCNIPLTTGQLMYRANDPQINNAVITIRGVYNNRQMEQLEEQITGVLAAKHYFDPTDKSALYIQNNIEMFKQMNIVFGAINIFVWIIGLGTLLAGIVGVSNIMLVTVTERTAEFGIRKALGAKPSSIIRLILTESVMVTALFGYMGMVLGVGVMEVVNYLLEHSPKEKSEFGGTIFLNPTLDLSVVTSATIVLVLAGLVAGYIPARRAARLKTIDAMRHNK